jgi:hypothetical protein
MGTPPPQTRVGGRGVGPTKYRTLKVGVPASDDAPFKNNPLSLRGAPWSLTFGSCRGLNQTSVQ